MMDNKDTELSSIFFIWMINICIMTSTFPYFAFIIMVCRAHKIKYDFRCSSSVSFYFIGSIFFILSIPFFTSVLVLELAIIVISITHVDPGKVDIWPSSAYVIELHTGVAYILYSIMNFSWQFLLAVKLSQFLSLYSQS